MSLLTNFLNLFKWNTSDAEDLEEEFDIDTAMNENWDKLDEAIEDLDTNKVDKVDGKGLSTNDFTNEYEEKLDGLSNYDDTELTQDIEDIQEEQTEQNTEIDKLQTRVEQLQANMINTTTEEATQIHIEDASTLPAKLSVRGNHKQETREGYNLVKILDYNYSFSGIDFTADVNEGWISATGTSTGASGRVASVTLPAGNYVFSGGPANGSNTGARMAIYDITDGASTLLYLLYADRTYATTIEEEKTFAFNYVIQSGITVNTEKIYPQVVAGTEAKPFEPFGKMPSIEYPSEIKVVKEINITINDGNGNSKQYSLEAQQDMLKKDCFVKETDGWKEVHLRSKRNIKEDITNAILSDTNNFIYVSRILQNTAKLVANTEDANVISNIAQHASYEDMQNATVDYAIGISNVGSLCIRCKDFTTLEEYKTALNNDNYYYYYYLATPAKLACTEAQSAVLEQLSELELFAGTNNIITAEDLALLQLTYTVDTKSYIDSKVGSEV